jgi:hypothetical protein
MANDIIIIFWDLTCCSLIIKVCTLKMQAVCSSRTFVPFYHATQRQVTVESSRQYRTKFASSILKLRNHEISVKWQDES